MSPHRRSTDSEDLPPFEHTRETDTRAAARHILGMPISALTAIGALVFALFGVWLTHDRAIAQEASKESTLERRVDELKTHDDDRAKSDKEVVSALARIEQKIDDVKAHVDPPGNSRRP